MIINEKILYKMVKEYNKKMNEKIKKNNWKDLSELKLRQVLTEEIRLNNKENYNNLLIDIECIIEILKKNDYIQLHKELQKIFNEFIPFITIKRFLNKVEQYDINFIFDKIKEHRNKGYSETICYIRQSN